MLNKSCKSAALFISGIIGTAFTSPVAAETVEVEKCYYSAAAKDYVCVMVEVVVNNGVATGERLSSAPWQPRPRVR